MESVKVNLRMRDEYGNIIKVAEATEWHPVSPALSIPVGLILLGLILKLLQYALVLL